MGSSDCDDAAGASCRVRVHVTSRAVIARRLCDWRANLMPRPHCDLVAIPNSQDCVRVYCRTGGSRLVAPLAHSIDEPI